jgi:hypothetical protein
LFCIYSADEPDLFEKYVGSRALEYVCGYLNAAQVSHVPNFGMSFREYRFAWHEKYAAAGVAFDFNSIASYTRASSLSRR